MIILVGIPGSGKSRYAKLLSESDGLPIVSSDEIRKELFGDINAVSHEQSKKAFEEVYRRIDAYKGNCIFDATNTTFDRLERFFNTDKYGEVEIHFLMDSFDPFLCHRRVLNDVKNKVDRSNVPKEVIERMYIQFTKLYYKIKDQEEIKFLRIFGESQFIGEP